MSKNEVLHMQKKAKHMYLEQAIWCFNTLYCSKDNDTTSIASYSIDYNTHDVCVVHCIDGILIAAYTI